jgi:hypothetical protein
MLNPFITPGANILRVKENFAHSKTFFLFLFETKEAQGPLA